MLNPTTQFHSKKVYRPVKYCESKESVEQAANSSAIVKYCMSNLQKEVMTHLSIETEIKKMKLLDRKGLLTPKTTRKAQVLPLTVTYNGTVPNIKQIIENHWSILKTNKALEKTFSVEPIIAIGKNKSLKKLIGGSTIQNDKNIKKSSKINMKGNVHLANVEYGHCVVYRYKTYIHFVANKIDGYLQLSTKSAAKAILSSIV